MSICRVLLILLLTLASNCWAETPQEEAAPSGPIEVTSRQMEADQLSNKVLFTGDVVARRGTMTVYAEQLSLFFSDTSAGRKIERLEAEGGVRVVDGVRVATSERLSYLQAEEMMTLIGNAKIHQGENLVAGDEIVLYIRENRSLVKSHEDGRVKAIFLPQQETP